ncbi:hypothetical protein GN958_ATG06659 [Phytophthora infestans]|uniref:Uncharacterized protein n=1 Tax=Phytophthora infestans TaxID=4787 RepID=A0A8S9UT35_PHYIN|nr:hypothetical protein GN958_ATG06659 [Phytophthora infestans]
MSFRRRSLDIDDPSVSVRRRSKEPPNALSDVPESEYVDPLACSMPHKPSASAMNSQQRHQLELMRRMGELRQNAESVYQLTWRNTLSMKCGGIPLQSQSVCIATVDLD